MDDRALLERLARSIPEPPDVMDGLRRRRSAKQRNARIPCRERSASRWSGVIVALALSTVGRDDVFVPDTPPPDPYESVWTSTDIADRELPEHDDLVAGRGLPGRPRRRGGVDLLRRAGRHHARDGGPHLRTVRTSSSSGGSWSVTMAVGPMVQDPFEFRGDPASGTLVDQSDTKWTRTP